MKTLRNLCMLITAIFLLSCEKESGKEDQLSEVVFGITQVDPLAVKSDENTPVCQSDLVPTKAHIVINGLDYYPLVALNDDKLYTQAIKLPVGNYTVSKFLLLDASDSTLMAMPAAGSDYAVYVKTTVDFPLVVEKFEKVQMEVELLCFEEARYDEFGFTWFYTERIVVKKLCFFGDLCIEDASVYQGTLYANDTLFPSAGIFDAPAIFKVVVKKDSIEVEKSPFDNEEWLGIGQPLCVEYPDRIDLAGEVFTFELWVLVPSTIEGMLIYQRYATFTTTDGNPIVQAIDNENMVVFSIGDCAYNPDNKINVMEWLDALVPQSVSGFGFKLSGRQSQLLGVGDLKQCVTQTIANIPDGSHSVVFSYDNTTKLITLTGLMVLNLSTNITSHSYPQCGNYNALVITVNDLVNVAAIEWQNVKINGVSIGSFDFYDIEGTPGYKEWIIPGDFTQSFTITANLVTQDLFHKDALKAEMFIKCFG